MGTTNWGPPGPIAKDSLTDGGGGKSAIGKAVVPEKPAAARDSTGAPPRAACRSRQLSKKHRLEKVFKLQALRQAVMTRRPEACHLSDLFVEKVKSPSHILKVSCAVLEARASRVGNCSRYRLPKNESSQEGQSSNRCRNLLRPSSVGQH